MNLNYNSVSSKIYRDFYNTQVIPESLCPYWINSGDSLNDIY
jgi:hypothetical protein